MAREMKDSGVEWIGEIPADWDVSKVKYSLKWKSEKGQPRENVLSLYRDYGVVLKASRDDNHNVTSLDTSGYKVVDIGDFVINKMKAWQGSMSVSEYRGIISPAYHVCEFTNNKVHKKYFHYLMRNKSYLPEYTRLSTGMRIGQWDLGFNDFKNIPFLLPSQKEQEEIANYLDQKCSEFDNVLEKTRASVNEYKKLKQAVITRAITKGIRGDREMRDSGIEWIGEIPKKWHVKKLGYLGKCQNGISKSSEYFGEGYPFVSYGDVYRNYQLPEIVKGLIMSTDSDRENYSVVRGDVLFTRTSETIEEVGFSSVCLKTIEHATFAGFVIRFRPYSHELLPEYSKFYFRSDMHRRFFVKEMNLVTRASLGQELLKKLPVILPPLQEQEEIANYLEKQCEVIDGIIAKKNQYITELESYKKSLIYECVTGKKEVPQEY